MIEKIVLMGLKQEGDQKLNEPRCLGGASFYSFWGSSLSQLSVLETVLFAQPRERESPKSGPPMGSRQHVRCRAAIGWRWHM